MTRERVASLMLVVFGAGITLFGMHRLGWRRHGAPALDFGWLHLEWITSPASPQWFSHLGNLALLLGGAMLTMVALGLVLARARDTSPLR